MSVHLRPADPSDVDAAVPLIYSSGPAGFDFVFAHRQRSAQEFLRTAFTAGSGEFGHLTHTVATIDGVVVGVGATFSGDGVLRSTIATGVRMLGFYRTAAAGPMIRGLRIERLLEPPRRDTQIIAHLGVDPHMRGKGIGTDLVELFLATGRRDGRRVAALDVSVENPDAQRLYERLGFRVEHEVISKLRNDRATVPNHRRMVLDL